MSKKIIYLDDAIDAVKKHYRTHDNDLLELIAFDIERLPSAQPEIIRCKECDYWNERQGRMYCGEMYFDQDDPDFYCGYAERKTDG